MAVMDRGKYHTNSGWIPALVVAQYDSSGDVVADGASGENGDVDTVDVVLLGRGSSSGQGQRSGVSRGTSNGQFEFTDTLAS